jgi:hypothetical protein
MEDTMIGDNQDFLRGFSDGSGLPMARAGPAYEDWLEYAGYEEIYRIDLESGGYAAGLEVGQKWRENNPF